MHDSSVVGTHHPAVEVPLQGEMHVRMATLYSKVMAA